MPIIKAVPEILHAIVGTAGHVDHGKTSLVKLLTGCETDRLPEEKARGMSIDLGFAPCLLRGRRVVGIVDVPGHKDFIRNMVAGATSIDVLLLVVAADDGVMPQTDEHVKIIKLLRAPQVMVALTKIDMVSPDMLELAKADVAAFMARAGFPDAPIIPVSNKTGEGVGDVLVQIEDLVDRARQRTTDRRALRMNIERVFGVKGYGTVVTGIPMAGQVNIGERVELLPPGRELTVRTIQSYKHESPTAYANCCCAVNVRDIEANEVARGMTIAHPGIYHATNELIISVQNATDDRTLKRRFIALLHTGTGAVEASLKLLDCDSLPPGQEAIAHVVLTEPQVIAAGDRFIIRAISPAITLGGGIVLSSRPQKLRKFTEDVLDRLLRASKAVIDRDFLLSELLSGPSAIIHTQELSRLTQCAGVDATEKIKQAESRGDITDLGGGAWLVTSRLHECLESISHVLDRYHAANPYTWGMTSAHVCEHFGIDLKNFPRLSKLLCESGRMSLKHGRLALTSFAPAISAHLMSLREQILAQIHSSGVNAPARGNLMKELHIAEPDMQVLEKLIVEDGTVLVLDGNFMLRSVFEQCRNKLLELFAATRTLELGAFRDCVNTNRKMALAMLDAFDAEGLTKRVGDGRVLAKPVTPSPEAKS